MKNRLCAGAQGKGGKPKNLIFNPFWIKFDAGTVVEINSRPIDLYFIQIQGNDQEWDMFILLAGN